jgi:Flp pilus assembly protein TadG
MAPENHRPGWRTRRCRSGERGQSLIEFTLLAPVLLLLLLGMLEFGNALNSYLTVVASARDAARMGAKYGIETSGQTLMHNVVSNETARLANGPITSDNCNDGAGVCIQSCVTSNSCSGSGIDMDKQLSVRVCYEHPLIIGIPFFMRGPIDMCSQTTIRMQ